MRDNLTKQRKLLLRHLIWVLVLALASLVPILAVYLDTVIFGWGVKETGVTESIQHLLLLAITGIFGYKALVKPEQRGFLILCTGFFLVILIRELDAFFDLITHGFWLYPALTVTAVACIWAGLHYLTILEPMLAFFRSQQGMLMVTGLVIVLLFSRVFGTTSLWSAILQDEASKSVKTIVQEGLELLGYVFIFLGTCHPRWTKQPDQAKVGTQE